MKKKNKVSKKPKVVREKKITLGNRIVIILQQRNDVTRLMLPDLLGKSLQNCDSAMIRLRKQGYKIWPSKGLGSVLRIATNQAQLERFNNYRRQKYVPTVNRMIISEIEAAEQFPELSSKPAELLKLIKSENLNTDDLRDNRNKQN